ncbi:LCP family protein [Oceanobacillus sp. Castelsardo]|uniref:LCP family glycopolymer transferase n=1 Tax=Oceanobacillus sp. Castelsardo TaxID=1851204 RepID=UPI000A48EE2B|nr:LCP family protein [Oceanobacillus sp. Castelsardo]
MEKPLWKKISLIVLSIVLVLIIGVGAYTFSIFSHAKQVVNDNMQETVTNIDKKVVKQKVNDRQSLNILLLGVDKRGGDRGRSDALMVLSLDPKNDRMQLVSIPRDTRTLIVGKGTEDKINHAYAFGGADMSIATVENLLDIELDYFVQINMEGLADLVDLLGGITVENELDWVDTGYYQKGYHYEKGQIQLDGPQAMGFIRMRYQDPKGDFGRTERQRKVIAAILDKGVNIGAVNKIKGAINVLGNNMTTNMDFDDMQDLLFNYASVRHNSESYMMQGSGTKIDGVYYYLVPEEEVMKVHGMIEDMES